MSNTSSELAKPVEWIEPLHSLLQVALHQVQVVPQYVIVRMAHQ